MRNLGRGFVTGVVMVAACGGGEKKAADTTSMAPPSAQPAPGAAPGAAAAVAAKPATGKTWDVKMLGDGTSYRFEPASITISAGDAIKWTVVSGQPHDVAFWPDSIPAGAQAQLNANMPTPMSPLAGPLLTNLNDNYTISFAGVPPAISPSMTESASASCATLDGHSR
jgi:plastocyanin